MLVTKQPLLRRFWYALAPVAALEKGPVGTTLLGENLVLWLGPDGKPSCLRNRCCHRTMKLSKGRIADGTIMCPYHGWAYDATGRCVRIPQAENSKRKTNFKIEDFRCVARHGVVWVALEEPLLPIPDLPEFDDPAFRLVPEFHEVWNAPGLRIMENSFDNAHFSYVHAASFGINEEPQPAALRIEDNAAGFDMYSDIPVKNPEIQKKNLGISEERTVRHVVKTWWIPFARKMRIRYPSGLIHIICTLTAPIDDRRSTVVQFALRNDSEEQVPAANVVAFDRQVTNEDKAILEECDWDVPLDLKDGGEFHMPSDRPGLLMRQRLSALLRERGEAEARTPSIVRAREPAPAIS